MIEAEKYKATAYEATRLQKEYANFWQDIRASWKSENYVFPLVKDFADESEVVRDIEKFIAFYGCRENRGIRKINIWEAVYIRELWKLHRPKLVVEIGIHYGISTKIFGLLAREHGSKVISIDGKVLRGVVKQLEQLKLQDYVTTIEAWTPWLGFPIDDWEIDMLHIDGDHNRVSCLADFHYFNRYLNKDGIVIFHDADRRAVRNAINIILESYDFEDLGRFNRYHTYRKLNERNEVWLHHTHTDKFKQGF